MSFCISCVVCLITDIADIYLEQETTGRNKNTQSDEQLTMNSEGSMHQKSNELEHTVTFKDTEVLGQRSRNFHQSSVISPYPDNETSEKCR